MDLEKLATDLITLLHKHGCDEANFVTRTDSIQIDAYPSARRGNHDPDYVKTFDKVEVTVQVKGAR